MRNWTFVKTVLELLCFYCCCNLTNSTHAFAYCIAFTFYRTCLTGLFSLWERGAATVGIDFAAHSFWDKYLEFETSQGAFPRVTALFHRIIQIPLDQLTQYHERFKLYVNSRPLSELLFPNEVEELEEEKKKQEVKYKELTAKKEEGESIDPSEISAAGIKTGDEVEVEFRARVMTYREETFKKVSPLAI